MNYRVDVQWSKKEIKKKEEEFKRYDKNVYVFFAVGKCFINKKSAIYL